MGGAESNAGLCIFIATGERGKVDRACAGGRVAMAVGGAGRKGSAVAGQA